MHLEPHCIRMSLVMLLSLLNVGFGLYAGATLLVSSGALGACYAALMMSRAGAAA